MNEQMKDFKGQPKQRPLALHRAEFKVRRKCCQFKILMIFTLSSELQPEYQMNRLPVKRMPDAEKPPMGFARREYFGAKGV